MMIHGLKQCVFIIMCLLVMSIRCTMVCAASDVMVLVEGGSFLMGNAIGGQATRQVTVNSFYMSKYEVTFEEYDEFCQETGRTKPKDFNWGRKRYPVVGVSWQDAVQFCNWLSQKEGLIPAYCEQHNYTLRNFSANGYRLPTEAEWEYAAKGGIRSQGYKYSGSNDINEVAWYEYNSGNRTHQVGQKRPNELGLYDMNGNVWEWCWDWYKKPYYEGYNDNEVDATLDKFRAIRGGSMNFYACSPSCRFNYPVSARIIYIGFRLVRTAF